MPSPIISFQNISKNYRIYSKYSDRIWEALNPFSKKRHQDFFALKDITFHLNQGESVGIVGVNGSGKTTLLKILCGVLTPSAGKFLVNGKVSALLELGSGFHPDRTGLENLYFQGAIQGIPRSQVLAMIPKILEFADIGEFINQPIKMYSSGMYIRLAFAAAVQMKPDILIVDEALAVGDICFQRRCFQCIEELKKNGVTFILVSHSVDQIVANCSRALLLSHGQLIMDDTSSMVMNKYMDILFGHNGYVENKNRYSVSLEENLGEKTDNTPLIREETVVFLNKKDHSDKVFMHPWYNKYEYRWGDGSVKIIDIDCSSNGNIQHIASGDKITLVVKTYFMEDTIRPIWGCNIKNHEGIVIYGTNSEINKDKGFYPFVKAGEVVYIKMSFICDIFPGEYFISIGVAKDGGNIPLDRRYDALLLVVYGSANFYGFSNLHMTMKKLEECYE